MREVLFRGKRAGNGEWVEGQLLYFRSSVGENELALIVESCEWDNSNGWFNLCERAKVIPASVSEFTGLTDKNGKKIFEGDIFRIEDDMVGVVIYENGCFRMKVYGLCGAFTESGYDECGGGWDVVECESIDWLYIHDMEIIGNIHDNPELLEGR